MTSNAFGDERLRSGRVTIFGQVTTTGTVVRVASTAGMCRIVLDSAQSSWSGSDSRSPFNQWAPGALGV
jgi:hypothetical protein